MAKIQGNGRPTQFMKGAKGDVYTDLNTGKRYECLGSDGFVGRGQSNELVKYDWIMLKEFGVVSGGGTVDPGDTPSGGASDCDWEIMKNKPFGEETTRLVCCENQIIDIVETSNPSGTYYSGRTDGFGEFGTVTGSDMSAVYNWNVKDGDKIVVVIDGTEYEDVIHGRYVMYAGDYSLKAGSSWEYKSDNPFHIVSNTLGFEICMPAENVGTYTVSIYAYVSEVKQLDERFIPGTIARKSDISGGGVSSWNDLTDKPFYDSIVELSIGENKSITITENTTPGGTNYYGYFMHSVELGSLNADGWTRTWKVKDGDKAKVKVDGVEYEATIYCNGNRVWFGNYNLNTSYSNVDGSTDNVPFLIEVDSGRVFVYMGADDVGDHEISVSVYYNGAKTLDEKFIPDTIARVKDIPSGVMNKTTTPYTKSADDQNEITAVNIWWVSTLGSNVVPQVNVYGVYKENPDSTEEYVVPLDFIMSRDTANPTLHGVRIKFPEELLQYEVTCHIYSDDHPLYVGGM